MIEINNKNDYLHFNHSANVKLIIFKSIFYSKRVLNLCEYKLKTNSEDYINVLKSFIPLIHDKYDNLHVYENCGTTLHVSHKARYVCA